MKHTLNPDKTASPGKGDNRPSVPLRQPRSGRRTLLGWMVGIAAGAFAVSFAVPAAALKALMLEKPIMASDRALPGVPIADGPNGTVLANGLFDGPIGPQ
jgi:hypothetical protein